MAPYGIVEIEYSGKMIHRLQPSYKPTDQIIDLTHFDEMVVAGTPFQEKVWQSLTQIPCGSRMTYGDIAHKIGHPKAFRAVGSAVGANPIGILIPCHRVISKDGSIGGFAWGIELKKQWLSHESTTAHL